MLLRLIGALAELARSRAPVLDLVGEVAPPCVEFSRFVLGRGAGDVGPEVLATMKDLDDGARGYYLQVSGTATVRAGSRLLRR